MPVSTTAAPDFFLYRQITAADSGPFTDINAGVNCGHYRFLNVAIASTIASAVEVMFWNPAAGEFVSLDPAITRDGNTGADVNYNFTVEAYGQIVFIAGTTVAAALEMRTACYGLDHTL